MHLEVNSVINFVATSLYNKLPRRRVDAFGEELERGMLTKFQGHWYPENPSRGSAHRCIHVSGEKMDPIIVYSIINTGLDIEEVSSYLPKDLTIWVDPGEVSFSIGDKGQVRLLYSARRKSGSLPEDIPASSNSLSSSTQSSTVSSPENELASFGSLSLSSHGSSNVGNAAWSNGASPIPWSAPNNNNPWSNGFNNKAAGWNCSDQSMGFNQAPVMPAYPVNNIPQNIRANSNQTMTAAMFAKTKFGSTKLKTNSKRSSRLSPSDNFNFNKQYNQHENHPMNMPNGGNFNGIPRPTTNGGYKMIGGGFDPMASQNPFANFQFDDMNNRLTSMNQQRQRNPYTLNNNGQKEAPVECVSPNSLSSLTSTSDANDWIDLTDMSVYPNGLGGNTLLTAN